MVKSSVERIRVFIKPGTRIHKAIDDALVIAKQFGVPVEIAYNQRMPVAGPNMTRDDVLYDYRPHRGTGDLSG